MSENICEKCKRFWIRKYLDVMGKEKTEVYCSDIHHLHSGEITLECDSFDQTGVKEQK